MHYQNSGVQIYTEKNPSENLTPVLATKIHMLKMLYNV